MNNMETGNEKQNVNIADILRYAPKGLKLYSPLIGEVRLEKVSDHDDTIVVTTKYKSERVFFEDGKYDSNGECLLFPSKDHREWNNWQNILFPKSIGSVCVHNITGNKFILGEDGTYFDDNSRITGSSFHFLIDGANAGNYLLDSRYATPEEAKEFFEELNKNGYKWNGETVVKIMGKVKPKFKVGDVIRHKDTGIFFAIAEVKDDCYYSKGKTCLLFKYQDNWELVASKANLSLEDKVSMMADEIIALKQRVTALEIQAIRQTSDLKRLDALEKLAKDSEIKIDALECGGKPFQCPDKAGDNVTLEDMKS